jgi:hypothetical protein
MAKDFFHINFEPEARWLRSIITRLQRSPSTTLRQRLVEWGEAPLLEKVFALATKLEILRTAIDRLDADLLNLWMELENNPREVEACIAGRAAFPLREDLTYQILADVDAFLFELKSAYEIMKIFLKEFFPRILGQQIHDRVIEAAIKQEGGDTDWVVFLSEERNLFIHRKAPWIAIEVTSRSPARYDLLILKSNTRDLANPDDYMRLEDYRTIYQGVIDSTRALNQWIIREIERVETNSAYSSPSMT